MKTFEFNFSESVAFRRFMQELTWRRDSLPLSDLFERTEGNGKRREWFNLSKVETGDIITCTVREYFVGFGFSYPDGGSDFINLTGTDVMDQDDTCRYREVRFYVQDMPRGEDELMATVVVAKRERSYEDGDTTRYNTIWAVDLVCWEGDWALDG